MQECAMRNAECAMKKTASWRVEQIHTARGRILPVEALDCSGRIETVLTKRSRILPAGAPRIVSFLVAFFFS